MRRRRGPELTDADLTRLERLGAGAETIAEAAGLDALEVERRLDRVSRSRAPRREEASARWRTSSTRPSGAGRLADRGVGVDTLTATENPGST